MLFIVDERGRGDTWKFGQGLEDKEVDIIRVDGKELEKVLEVIKSMDILELSGMYAQAVYDLLRGRFPLED